MQRTLPQIDSTSASSTLDGIVTDDSADLRKTKRIAKPSPEATSNIFSLLSFGWLDPLIYLGNKRILNDSDVWDLHTVDHTRKLYERKWNIFKERPILALVYSIRASLAVQFLSSACVGVLSVASPFWLSRILAWLQEDSSTREQRLIWFYLLGMVFTDFLKAAFAGQQYFNGRRSGMQARSILNSQIYEKSLRRGEEKIEEPAEDDTANENASIGKIVSLMSTDTDRIRNFICYVHEPLIGLPLSIICSFAFLISVMGWSAFIGLTIIIALLPTATVLGKMINEVEDQESSTTDKRVDLTNEVLQGIRIIKFFAWEPNFIERIGKIRVAQLNYMFKAMLLFLAMGNIAYSSGTVVTVVTFVAHTVVFRNALTAATAFTSLKLLHQTSAFIGQLPDWFMMSIQAKVSWDRVHRFLAQVELAKYETSDGSSNTRAPTPEEDDQTTIGYGAAPVVGVRRGWFTYHSIGGTDSGLAQDKPSTETPAAPAAQVEQFTLRDIDVSFPTKLLSVICGATGCGKTTLLLSLLGETNRLRGKAYLPDPSSLVLTDDPANDIVESGVAYVAQSAWLLNATIRDNICFGLPFNRNRYRRVLRACALVKDLETFEGGDLTEIGEKGINLSGGQKQRVSLARAAYSRAATVLLDDPLSAVDAPTARHLFRHCILGVMRNRTRLLVTHAVPLVLPRADFVLVMKSGSMVAQGLPGDVMADAQALEILGQELNSAGTQYEGSEQASSSSSVSSSVTDLLAASSSEEEDDGNGETDLELDAVLAKRPKMLVEEESRATGSVRKDVYEMYINAMGGPIVIVAYVCTFVIFTVCEIGDGAWLATWANASGNSSATNSFGVESVSRSSWVNGVVGVTFGSSLGRMVEPSVYTPSFASVVFIPEREDVLGTYSWPVAQNDSMHYSPNDGDERPPVVTGPISLTTFITVYCLFGLAIMICDNINLMLLNFAIYWASEAIHEKLLKGVMNAPMRFFETTPVGRILNRFSKDIQQIDSMNWILNGFMRCALRIVMTTIMLAFFLPPFLLVIPLIAWIYVFVSQAYLNTSRELKRLESISRSPVYALFSETLSGVTTIRAYGQEERFAADNDYKTDENHRPWFYLWAANRWLCFRTDVISALVVLTAATVLIGSGMSAGWSGLILTYSLNYSDLLLWFVRSSAEVEISMNAMERIREYVKLEPEPPAIIEPRPEPAWPQKGEIEFKQLSVRYAPDLPPVLKNMSVHIQGGHKIGIVGRTGAGKSSFALSLFRIIPFDPVPDSERKAPGPTGTIFIDGVDISSIGLRDLRGRLTIIPQDPVLFSGTLRQALDPLEESDEVAVWESLERVQFLRSMQQHQDKLEADQKAADEVTVEEGSTSGEGKTSGSGIDLSYPISENGSNLSQGQRQLLCMARALLRKSRVVVLDEATASVDNDTDALMQRTIREHMTGATILTIAHRLRTIIDYDRVLVLDQGEIIEYDTPYNLITKSAVGHFRKMCEETGEFEELVEMARKKQEGEDLVVV
ncbi:P-loop containing nucleoside triphosphate hydrolase protein [Cladochytrium replicatum]|nr:P-loop containing nucleoside triphosphate hydrolase protein [Cladochytrium replicatum]